jgi:hypothetical protein
MRIPSGIMDSISKEILRIRKSRTHAGYFSQFEIGSTFTDALNCALICIETWDEGAISCVCIHPIG